SSTLDALGFPDMTVQEAMVCSRSDVISAIQAKKKKEGILEWALVLLKAKADLDGDTLSRVESVLRLTLVQDPRNRASSLGPVLELLDAELPRVVEHDDESQSETILSRQPAKPEPSPGSSSSSSDTASPSLLQGPDWHGKLRVGHTHLRLSIYHQ